MGHLDDLLGDTCTSLLMLDHTDGYINQRRRPLTSRCRHVIWSAESLDALRAEGVVHDWLVFLAVFFHLDDATAAALIRTLGERCTPAPTCWS